MFTCVVLSLDLTAYRLNRALGLLHCRGATHTHAHTRAHTHTTPATRLPWRGLTLIDSEPRCGNTMPIIYVQCVLSYIISGARVHLLQTTEQLSWRGTGPRSITEGQFSTYSYKAGHMQCCTDGCWFHHDWFSHINDSGYAYVWNPKLTFNVQFINSKDEPI